MNILGIAGLADVEPFLQEHFPEQLAASRIVQGMDAAAALICQGRVIAAVSQERFDRTKKSGAFPYDAIDYCLTAGNLSITDIGCVVGNFDFGRFEPVFRDPVARMYWDACLSPRAIRQKLTDRYGAIPPFEPTDHHDAHLHCALATAPFADCMAVVMDAAGEIGSTSIYHVTDGQVSRIKRFPIRQSLGMFYSLITQFLGFAFNEDEYKIMGLAALGDPRRYAAYFEDAIRLLPQGEIDIPVLAVHGFADGLFFASSRAKIAADLGFDGHTCSIGQRADISAALQARFTEALFHLCRNYKASFEHLLFSGGCAENCMAVGEVRRSEMFRSVHVGYAAGDEGTALGAALVKAYQLGQAPIITGEMPFYGPAPQTMVVRDLAASYPVTITPLRDELAMLRAAAQDIADDKIVAVCNGRMEYGARALGNRSLLALPSNPDNQDRINLAIKKRQSYRPFAPAVLAEDAHLFFDLEKGEQYPYMTMLTQVRDDQRDSIPAVTHIDGTARVQTVSALQNPSFYLLLRHLKRLTGQGVVLNTSYNVNHQPIVCSEREAIETFLEMGIDALYMGECRIARI